MYEAHDRALTFLAVSDDLRDLKSWPRFKVEGLQDHTESVLWTSDCVVNLT